MNVKLRAEGLTLLEQLVRKGWGFCNLFGTGVVYMLIAQGVSDMQSAASLARKMYALEWDRTEHPTKSK